MSGSRSTLVADLKADKMAQEQDTRYNESQLRYKQEQEKQAKAETWAKEQNTVADLAQQLTDRSITLKEFNAALAKEKEAFPDHTSTIDQIGRTAVRNMDTTQFNTYKSEGMTLSDFQKYADSRKKDGGDLSHMNELMSMARNNEDTKQYGSYQNGLSGFDQFQTYAAQRAKDGGDLTKLNGYIASAQTNENKVGDQMQSAAYSAGTLPPKEYRDYLNSRISRSVDSREATTLRGQLKSFESNEILKSADDVRAEYEAGNINGATAAQRLLGIRAGTNDAAAQKGILGLVGQIQAKDAAAARSGASSAQSSVTRLHDSMKAIVADSESDHTKAAAAIDKYAPQSKSGTEYQRLAEQYIAANTTFRSALEHASEIDPDQQWARHYLDKAVAQDATLSRSLFLLGTQTANNIDKEHINPQTGENTGKYGESAKFLIQTLSSNPYMSQKDRLAAIELGSQKMTQDYKDITNSPKGLMWRDFVDNRTQELFQKVKTKDAAGNPIEVRGIDLLFGKLPIDHQPKSQGEARSLVEQMLLNSPDEVRSALERAGIEGFHDTVTVFGNGGSGPGSLPLRKGELGKSADDFSKQVEDLSGPIRQITRANDETFRQTGVDSLNMVLQARANLFGMYGSQTGFSPGYVAANKADNENEARRAAFDSAHPQKIPDNKHWDDAYLAGRSGVLGDSVIDQGTPKPAAEPIAGTWGDAIGNFVGNAAGGLWGAYSKWGASDPEGTQLATLQAMEAGRGGSLTSGASTIPPLDARIAEIEAAGGGQPGVQAPNYYDNLFKTLQLRQNEMNLNLSSNDAPPPMIDPGYTEPPPPDNGGYTGDTTGVTHGN